MDSFAFLWQLGVKADPEAAHFTFFAVLLFVCYLTVRLFEKKRWLNDSITSLAIGIFTGIIVLLTTRGKSSHILEFNEQLFFIYLLPPIIFNAGFQVKKKQFFRNFLVIILFGAFGSVISFFIISLGSLNLLKKLDVGLVDTQDYFALGAILTATDSVCTLQVLKQDETPLLYSLVFGEGVVNDATSVVLFNAIKKFDLSHITSTSAIQLAGSFFGLFSGSTLLGIAVGLLCAFIIKKLSLGRHPTDYEVVPMILMAYLSYMMAELLLLSGILSVFFCGIVMSHYTSWNNVNDSSDNGIGSSRLIPRHAFATLSFVAEIFIFLYVGMDALDIEKWNVVRESPGKSVGASLILLGLVLVGRAAFVFPLSFISNLTRKHKKDHIGFKQQFTIWWAGLMRGAVSVALAYHQFARSDEKDQGDSIMITSTISIVLFTNVVFGLLTKSLVRRMIPRNNHSAHLYYPLLRELNDPLVDENDIESSTTELNQFHPESFMSFMRSPTKCFHYYWYKFDDCFMRPVFGGSESSLEHLTPSSSP
ncbi:sodium/hydrogen exchanger 3-like [Benincasa hispida]|uniref:sodium/hydrogen exchanger 3-like n=1 Tax=Benincasa hispida TaxID=102211 RepID=UPI0018FF63B3|nr:sodium/hydrogen exchanger 3-like [Benincasa hispida]